LNFHKFLELGAEAPRVDSLVSESWLVIPFSKSQKS